jgi:hypothetical protein
MRFMQHLVDDGDVEPSVYPVYAVVGKEQVSEKTVRKATMMRED